MCNFFGFIKWLLPVLRLTEVTMTGKRFCITIKQCLPGVEIEVMLYK